jgi:hypothetical protein
MGRINSATRFNMADQTHYRRVSMQNNAPNHLSILRVITASGHMGLVLLHAAERKKMSPESIIYDILKIPALPQTRAGLLHLMRPFHQE